MNEPAAGDSALAAPAARSPRHGDGLVVVTGASGHLGNTLIRALLAAGRRVRAVVRDDVRALEGLSVERVRADLFDEPALQRALAGADVVQHLAAHVAIDGASAQAVRTNIEGTRRVVAGCRAAGVRRLVHFSSVHAFDWTAGGVVDETCVADETAAPSTRRRSGVTPPGGSGHGAAPRSNARAYGRSKIGGEREVLRAVAEDGLDAVIVNPAGCIGPHDFKPSAFGAMIIGLGRRTLPALVAGGFDWVDARDVAAGAIAAAERGRRGERYLLGGSFRPVDDLARMIAAELGVRPPRFTSPMWLARLGVPLLGAWARLTGARPLYTAESLATLRLRARIDHSKAARELGHAPRPLQETVRDTVRWHREQGNV